ncbi:MAG: biopolymer transporter ExbD [Cetobacterium sp.]
MRRRTKKRSLATPDLTPLIDVVFLLLIFFMLVTTFDKYSGFNLELPNSGIKSEIEKKEYELIIDKNEKYFIKYDNKSEEILIEEFSEKLRFIEEISISADKTLAYGVVVKIIGELKTVGITKVELNFYE